MYLRWDRSYVREETRFARIVWKRPPLACAISLFTRRSPTCGSPCLHLARAVRRYSIQDPMTLVRMLIGIGLISIYMFYSSEASARGNSCTRALRLFLVLTLLWIFPYARSRCAPLLADALGNL